MSICWFHFAPYQRQSLDQTFLRDAVLERLQDDVPEVVATSLKVLEVCLHQGALPPSDLSRVWISDSYCFVFVLFCFALCSSGVG